MKEKEIPQFDEFGNKGVAGHDDSKFGPGIPGNVGEVSIDGEKSIPIKISYQDKNYPDKRRILRQLSIKPEIKNCLDIMADSILNYIMDRLVIPSFLDETILYHHIKNLLIDGYLAFEIIYDKNNKVIDITPLDPVTLIVNYESNGEKGWIQYSDKPDLRRMLSNDQRMLSNDQIIYMHYSEDAITSYVEELNVPYSAMKTLENEMLMIMSNKMACDRNINKLGPMVDALKIYNEKLRIASKIPTSIYNGESCCGSSIPSNRFITNIYKIFKKCLFDNINKIEKLNKK